MGKTQSSLKPETAKKISEDLERFENLLLDKKIDMETKSRKIQGMLREIGEKMFVMDYETVSLYSGHFAQFVDYVMKNPDGKRIITAEVMGGIAVLSEELKALEKKKSPSELHQQLPIGIAKSEDLFLKSIPDQDREKIKREKVFKRIMKQSPCFIDNTRKDFFVKYMLSSGFSPDDNIDTYYENKRTPRETVMFIYIRQEERRRDRDISRTVNGKIGWVMIFWNAQENSWHNVGLNFDPSIEFSESAISFFPKRAESMSVLEDQKIPTEAEYFKLLRTLDFVSVHRASDLVFLYDLFENNVYEKMLGQDIRDSSGEYKILINQLKGINFEDYSKEIDKYHQIRANTEKNRVIYMELEYDMPFILMTYWSEKSAEWISLPINNNRELVIDFMILHFELDKLYEASFNIGQDLNETRKRYKKNAIKYNNIFQALGSGDKDVVKTLLDSNQSVVNTIGSKGNTPLIYVIKNSKYINLRNLDLLFETGRIDLDYVDMDGRTALHLAVINKLPNSLIHRLVGSDINLSDRYGFTALDYAATKGNEMYVKLLLILGASPKLNNTIEATENVRKIITDVAKESPLHETKGMLNEKALQHILFELYGFEINNPNINQDVSIAVATKLFKDELPQLKDHLAFSQPVARSRSVLLPLQESDGFEKKEDKSATAAAMPGGYSPHTWFHHCY